MPTHDDRYCLFADRALKLSILWIGGLVLDRPLMRGCGADEVGPCAGFLFDRSLFRVAGGS